MKEDKTFDSKFWKTTLIFSILIFIILFFPYLFTSYSWFDLDFINSGPIGDTIGGILTPFVAIIAAYLTFIAFWIQFKANQITIKNFTDQQNFVNVQSFENKFYEMIKLHIANINDIYLIDFKGSKIVGRQAFIELYNELRYTFFLIKNIFQTSETFSEYKATDDEIIFKVSYLFYFTGIGNEYNSILQESLLGMGFSSTFSAHLILKLEAKQSSINAQFDMYKTQTNDIIKINNIDYNFDIPFLFFSGHMSILGHYYRNLFQTVKYADGFDNALLNAKQKYNYVKTLRSQLSNYEQLLLYYNVISDYGYPWLNDDVINPNPVNYSNGYLIKYKMIKNIPLPLADFGITPKVKFEKEIELLSKKDPPEELFEWEEMIKRKKYFVRK